jgi:hypothetical protein
VVDTSELAVCNVLSVSEVLPLPHGGWLEIPSRSLEMLGSVL